MNILSLIVIAVISIILIRANKINKEKQEKLIKSLAIFMLVLEVLRIIWWLIYRDHNFKAIRFDWCNQVCLFMPFIVLFKIKKGYDVAIPMGLIGGIAVLIYPLWVFYDYGGLHLLSIQSMLSHGSMVVIPLLMIKSGVFKPEIENIKNAIIGLTFVLVLAFIMSHVRDVNYLTMLRADGIPLIGKIKEPYHLFFTIPYSYYAIILVYLGIYFYINYKNGKENVKLVKNFRIFIIIYSLFVIISLIALMVV